MSRGLGRRQRQVLEVCRAWAAAEPHPAWRWVPVDALTTAPFRGGAFRSEREAVRRAVNRLAEQGLVERGTTALAAWLLQRHAGDAWHHGPKGRPPPVWDVPGCSGTRLVARLPLSPEERVADDAARREQAKEAQAAAAMLRGLGRG